MTNLEKIIELSKSKGYERLSHECFNECDCDCVNCSFFQVMKHGNCSVGNCAEQLLEEYIEPKKLTKRERAFCVYVEKGWIARDKDKCLFFFKEKPCKTVRHDWASYDCNYHRVYDDIFPFITWEDEEPYSIEELLKWEFEE